MVCRAREGLPKKLMVSTDGGLRLYCFLLRDGQARCGQRCRMAQAIPSPAPLPSSRLPTTVWEVAAQGLGILVVLAMRLLPQVFGGWTLDADFPLQCLLVAAVMLALAGGQMAIYFAVGVERGRLATMIPALGVTLVFLLVVRSGTADGGDPLAGLVQASPETVGAAAIAACVGTYLLSLVASRQAFARRELWAGAGHTPLVTARDLRCQHGNLRRRPRRRGLIPILIRTHRFILRSDSYPHVPEWSHG